MAVVSIARLSSKTFAFLDVCRLNGPSLPTWADEDYSFLLNSIYSPLVLGKRSNAQATSTTVDELWIH